MRPPRYPVVLLLVASAIALATPAWAHGELRPGRAAAGSTVEAVLVVPSERDGHGNSRIALALPPSFAPRSCRAPIGWRCTTADKGFSWERVTAIVEAAEDFGLTMQVAGAPGTYVLPMAQTYDDGEIRTFTGAPGSRDEAPLFTVTGTTAGGSPTPASRSAEPRASTPSASRPAGVAPSASPGESTPPATASAAPSASAAPASVSSATSLLAGGLEALPAGRRLTPASSAGGPTALIALGMVAVTVLAGAVVLVRRRQGGRSDLP